jgi:uncharacterized membrane protein
MQPPRITYIPPHPVEPERPPLLPPLGCFAVVLALLLLCLLPLLLIEIMQTALERLYLPAPIAALVVGGVVIGSMINLPVYRLPRDELQPEIVMGIVYWGMMAPQYRRVRHETVIAVNVGGCVIPVMLAAWQILHVARVGNGPLLALAGVSVLNVVVCYFAARPMPGIGIVMPAFIAPLTAVGATWLVCGFWDAAGTENRAPIAFTAGVFGPIIGANLLHLKDLFRTQAGMLSIGGPGTFDSIILSGVLAALLA